MDELLAFIVKVRNSGRIKCAKLLGLIGSGNFHLRFYKVLLLPF